MSQRIVKRLVACAALAVALVGIVAGRRGADAQTPQPAAPPAQTPATQSDPDFDQAQALAELRRQIAGQEEKPAEQVFKNIQVLKGTPAGRLLRVMEMGYSRALGVNCTHCHVAGQWEKDDKPTKGVAREMVLMSRAINNDLLKKIKNLRSENPTVNCSTCHRGQPQPGGGGRGSQPPAAGAPAAGAPGAKPAGEGPPPPPPGEPKPRPASELPPQSPVPRPL